MIIDREFKFLKFASPKPKIYHLTCTLPRAEEVFLKSRVGGEIRKHSFVRRIK